MKAVAGVFLLLVSSALAGSLSRPSITPITLNPAQQEELLRAAGVDIDLCPVCIEFAGEFINELLNIVLNAGVIGGCEELCQLLEEEVHNEFAGVVCNILCDLVGIEAFIKIIEEADLDPIYYCELLKTCPIFDNGDAEIHSFTVKPTVVKHGSTFHIELLFQTQNGTGTGEIDLEINTADGIPVGQAQLMEPLAPGGYNVTWTVSAKPDPNCDPTQEPCEEWIPGNYTANVAICNGECGSKHPHSEIYDEAKAPFKVTN